MTTYFGIDFSLGSTGLAMFDGETWDTTTVKTKPLGTAHGDFIDRMDEIAGKVISWCDPHEGDVLALEGLALAAKSRALDRMFGGWWSLYRALREHGAEPFVVTTGTLKKLATGSGTADKDQMLLAAARRLQAAPVQNNDEADAAWLAVAAARIGGVEAVKLPKLHTDGLDDLIRGKRGVAP
ncbi:Holliday junction resolvasome RuvABC endonuclease subunit [Microbacterium testaceum]|uniref:crossover junction endodeoxyribonuclease RuvC n=1 Tax=Microbacterium TaxID=33882 RepID=UPI002783FFA6|nr:MULTISPECIES: crossover junction endodeoxyribonuclease RuvC [Microbacterium]MDQ1113976.1 Holliday junction resolvasome RuvABC endonuclease subunit [Microbacterium testaceum]MDR6098918.1 Holliday junction resolvasome RuvABC endonuclease subunit [Microbacterium sp. SORGH_AS_0454]